MKADQDASESLRPSSWYWLLIPAVLLLVQIIVGTVGVPSLPYSDFKQLLYAGKVREVTVGDGMITGMLKPDGLDKVLPNETFSQLKCKAGRGCPFSTVAVADPSLPLCQTVVRQLHRSN